MLKLLILLVTFWAIYVQAHAYTEHAQRELKIGESVIHGFTTYKVVEKKSLQTYVIEKAGVTKTAKRNEISIMDGCHDEFCIKDVSFDVGYLRYVTIEGITYGGDFMVSTAVGWEGFYQPFTNNLAITDGCHPSARRQLCVGDQVKDFSGNLMTIIALHSNYKLVLKSHDGWNSFRTYVDENSVRLIRE